MLTGHRAHEVFLDLEPRRTTCFFLGQLSKKFRFVPLPITIAKTRSSYQRTYMQTAAKLTNLDTTTLAILPRKLLRVLPTMYLQHVRLNLLF